MSSVKADQLFKVDGLVVVITGGGTGQSQKARARTIDPHTDIFLLEVLVER
jgi:hypothetical protein